MYSLGEARYAFAHGEAKDWGEHWREVGERQRLRRVQSEGRHGKTHTRKVGLNFDSRSFQARSCDLPAPTMSENPDGSCDPNVG